MEFRMNYWLRRLFTTPAYQDEEKTRQADLLNKYSLAVIAITSVVLVLQLTGLAFHREIPDLLRVLGVLFSALAVQALSRKGRIQTGSIVLMLSVWLVITLEIILYRQNGYTLINYASLVILAGLLSGIKGMWAMLGVSILSLVVVAFSEDSSQQPLPSSLLSTEVLFVFIVSMSTTTWMFSQALRKVRESGKALRESESRWQFALENAGDGLWDWNMETNGVFYSRQWKAMLGFDEHEIGPSLEEWESRVHPDDRTKCDEDLDRYLHGETPLYRNEHRVLCKDGSYKWVLDRGKVTERSAVGKPLRMIGLHTDVSARKESEEELRKTRDMLEHVIDSVPQSVFWKDCDGVYLGCNHSFARAVGHEHPSSVMGKTDYDLTPNRADAYRSDDREVIEKKLPKRHILEMVRRPDGRDVWVDTTKVPLVDEVDAVYGVLGVYDDITERVRAEERLKESQERAQRLASASFEGLGFAEGGRLTDSNEQLASMLGYSLKEIVGLPVMDFVAPESRATVSEQIRSGSETPYEHLAIRKDGTIFPVEVQGRVLSRQGKQIRVTAVRDISERKRAEAALHESETGFRNIVESAPLGMHIYELRPDGNLIFIGANPAADSILRIENSQFIGKTIEEAFPGLAGTEVPQRYREVAKTGKSWRTTQVDYDHDRIRGAFEVVAFQITEGRMVAMFTDITERKQFEDSLKRERNLLRTLIDNLPQNTYVYIKDAESRYVINNPAHLRSLGVTCQEDVLGKTSFDFFPPELAEEYFAAEQEVIRLGQPLIDREEAALDMVSGEMRWHLTTKVPLRDPSGRISGVVGMSMDITGRKKSAEALRLSEQKLRSLFETMAQGVVYQGADGGIIDANPAAERILGLTVAQLKERDSYNQQWGAIREDGSEFPGELHPAMVALATAREQSGVTMGVYHAVRKERRWIRIHAVPQFRPGDAKPFQVFSTFDDITDQKQADDALWAEKQRLAVTLRSIGDGVITTDTEGTIVIMNKVAEAMTGWSAADARGKPLTEVFHILHEKTREVCENPFDQVIKTKTVIELTSHTVLIARDGRELIIADSGAPILDDGGKIIGVVLVFRDMTEKQKLLETAQKSQKLESLGVLAGGIAHDFNNMLGGIFGYIDMARRKNADKDVERYLEKALGVFGRARDLTERLLTFSKGGGPVRKTARIDRLVRENTGFALSGSNINCEFSVAADLWLCDVDENQLGQVIDNIVINAKQAMPSGGLIRVGAQNLELEEGNRRGLPAGRYVQISVSDEGVGIPKENLSQIFDPFFTTKPKGNGLGLATSYSIVKKHDGLIEVESDVGKGSTFYVILPASLRDLVPVEAQQAAGHTGRGTMLVMDDEEFILEILRDWLTTMGFTVIRAHDGEEALELLSKRQGGGDPVIGVILDLTIPGGRGGRETISEIRKRHPDLAVFASSGYSDDPVMSKPAEYGFTGSIKKPYRLDDLAALLGKHMGK